MKHYLKVLFISLVILFEGGIFFLTDLTFAKIEKPDFVIVDYYLTTDEVGSEAYERVKIKNQGGSFLGKLHYCLKLTNLTIGRTLFYGCETNFNFFLKSGEVKDIQFSFTPWKVVPGSYKLEAEVDPRDLIKEKNENNNKFTREIKILEPKKCEDCGAGLWNVCDQKECQALGNCFFEKKVIGGECLPKEKVLFPDLLPVNLYLSKEKVGERANLLTEVLNFGEKEFKGDLSLKFKIFDKEFKKSVYEELLVERGISLSPGEQKRFPIDPSKVKKWLVTPGYYQISVTVDPDNQIKEKEEYNNVFSLPIEIKEITLPIQKPDFIITDLYLTTDQVGEDASLEVIVKNIGGSFKGDFNIRLALIDLATGAEPIFLNIAEYDITFAEGEEHHYSSGQYFSKWQVKPGRYLLKAIADEEKWVVEENENNNERTLQIEILEPKKCEDCGAGLWNVCDQKECQALGNCVFEKTILGGRCYPFVEKKPDFSVIKFDLTQKTPYQLSGVIAQIKNIGGGTFKGKAGKDLTIQFSLIDLTTAKVLFNFEITKQNLIIVPGQEIKYSSIEDLQPPWFWKVKPGKYELRINIDPLNKIEEEKENNNKVSKEIIIEAPKICEDSDNGKNFFLRGVTKSSEGNFLDWCQDSFLYEYFCQQKEVKVIKYQCPFGCKEGACLEKKLLPDFKINKAYLTNPIARQNSYFELLVENVGEKEFKGKIQLKLELLVSQAEEKVFDLILTKKIVSPWRPKEEVLFSTKEIGQSWRVKAGEYLLRAIIDYPKEIEEISEENNFFQKEIKIAPLQINCQETFGKGFWCGSEADFEKECKFGGEIKKVDIPCDSQGNTFCLKCKKALVDLLPVNVYLTTDKIGEEASIIAEVLNNGKVQFQGGLAIKFALVEKGTGQLVLGYTHTEKEVSLLPNEQKKFPFFPREVKKWKVAPGLYTISAVVDPENKIKEEDEKNNIFLIPIEIKKPLNCQETFGKGFWCGSEADFEKECRAEGKIKALDYPCNEKGDKFCIRCEKEKFSKITCKVLDFRTKREIVGAKISIFKEDKKIDGCLTDSQGVCSVSIPYGKDYQIVISAELYQTKKTTFSAYSPEIKITTPLKKLAQPLTTEKITIYKGWNLISSPFEEPLTIKEIKDRCGNVFSWIFPSFIRYSSFGNSWYSSQALKSVEAGYLYVTAKKEGPNLCTFIKKGKRRKFISLKLAKGWNLFSVPEPLSFSEIKGDCKLAIPEVVWGYNPQTKEWSDYSNLLDPKKGYWIKVKKDCILKK